MKKFSLKALLFASFCFFQSANAIELVIGEKRVEPGIVFIFEGAVKDHVTPCAMHLPEKETHVHIEARVNWDENNIPEGTPAGGFVPYLHVTAKVVNERTGLSTFIDLLPHMNLIDNFHYARNITLPGKADDTYKVTFNIVKPASVELALHKDWLDTYGEDLLPNQKFTFHNVDFEEITKATR